MRRLSALEKDYQRERNRLEASEISDSSERVLKSLRDMIAVLAREVSALSTILTIILISTLHFVKTGSYYSPLKV
ncbi:hypothetical protein IMCC1989_281 [gamma proteobacterium IMCC1989]|nr:hypothetical protein IMCC1989_281 [gamma proteobacterium IMCC1989]